MQRVARADFEPVQRLLLDEDIRDDAPRLA